MLAENVADIFELTVIGRCGDRLSASPGSRPRRRALAELIAKAVLGSGGAGYPAEASYVDGGSIGEQVHWGVGVRHDCGTCLS